MVLVAQRRKLIDALSPRAIVERWSSLTVAQCTMIVLMAVLLAIVLATYNRYGFTFDEFKGLRRATRILAFLEGNRNANVSGVDAFHGAAPDVIALVLQKLRPSLSYDSRHLVFALFGIAGVYYVYRFGSTFISEWVGVLAAMFLAVTPMWFGYMFINHKDIPFATLLLASSYYILLALTDRPTSPGLWLKVGLAIGLLASIKLAGLPMLVYVVAVYLACFAMIHGQEQTRVASHLVQRIGWTCLAGVIGCLICFLAFWPQFYWLDIVFRDMGPKPVFDRDLGPLYASIYFAVSTPIFLLVLAPVGAGWAIYRRSAPIIAATIVFASVLAAQAVTGARVYNGCRHILFLYTFFMLVAAYPVALLLDGTKNMLARVAVVGTLGLCIAATVVEMYRLFPYQYSFYNALVGGIEGADGVYEIDTWRSAHREAIEQIVPRVKPGETVRIFSCASKLNLRIHPGFELAKSQDDADYVIELRRKTGKCAKAVFDGLPLIGEVERKGVVLAKIYAVR